MKARMVLAAASIRKSHVVGRSRRKASFGPGKQPVNASLHRGLSPVVYDFALGDEDDRISYTIQKPRKAPVRYYTHANHLYSVAATTNAAGTVVERYSYNAYGVRTVKNSAGATLAKSAVGQDRGFTGYKLDSESALMYARARMYSAKLGRFVGRDFLKYIDGMNLYVYCRNDPSNRLDPSGEAVSHTACESAIKAGQNTRTAKKLLKAMADAGCTTPTVTCVCCGSGGGWTSGSTITICENLQKDGQSIIEAVAHELTHAYDNCMRKTPWDCDAAACMEIRAYNLSGACRKGGSLNPTGAQSYQECVKNSAIWSVENTGGPGGTKPCAGKGSSSVNKMWSSCFANTSPL